MKVCIRCNRVIDDEDFECPYCGHKIKKNQAGYVDEVIPIVCDKCNKKILGVVLEIEKEWVKKHHAVETVINKLERCIKC